MAQFGATNSTPLVHRASQLHRQLRGRGAAGVHRLGGDSPGAHQRRAGADLPKADRRDPEPHAAGPRHAPAPGEGGLARGHQDRVPRGSRLLHLAGDAASTGSYYYTKHSSQTGLLQVRQDNPASIK